MAQKGYMKNYESHHQDFRDYVGSEGMPCIFGKKAIEKGRYEYLVVETQMSELVTAQQVCEGLYTFIEQYGIARIGQDDRLSQDNFASFDVSFVNVNFADQTEAANELYTLLVNMHKYDVDHGYAWADGVSRDPHNPSFQMSVGGHAWFLPLLWPQAYAPSRRSPHVYLPWQSNNLFEALRKSGKYNAAQEIVRKEEIRVHGFIPKLLGQLGNNIEILSYLLPHEDDVDIVWDALNKAGGEYPFGQISHDNDVKMEEI